MMLCGRARHPLANHKLSAPFHATTMALPLVRTALLAGRAHGFSAPRKRTCSVTIPPELEAQILRYYHVERWRPNTIARQLNVHHGTVASWLGPTCRVISTLGPNSHQRSARRASRSASSFPIKCFSMVLQASSASANALKGEPMILTAPMP